MRTEDLTCQSCPLSAPPAWIFSGLLEIAPQDTGYMHEETLLRVDLSPMRRSVSS
ncbi:MAG TPA: hypothetical protein DEF41_15040 [Desulfovibrio sp.]|uniref:Uncharacterized protein n=1 Tax=Nitratidesulfovibrio vulgaris (strain ATCC 29579 / DSM 644 / CCUG 34227 / NCIMB 8303 / VKM B-1760 / Hildenborough) TaxID=882 RepID=Q72AE8_NITV2|nr:hypothetical protein DVU_2047 [Nitratidesulfovibrio vulgaris str. Hildenborough]HBW17392.1 hypothetical protein [Desulfovibrio sp.]